MLGTLFRDPLKTIARLEPVASGFRVRVETVIAPELQLGESVTVNGVCLTVTAADATGWQADIGPETVRLFSQALADAKTVVWNGPMGVFEIGAFAKGTLAIAQAVANVKGTTIIGGGDSIAAINKAGVADRVTHISTGGGASLEFLGGRRLPGVEVLPNA